MLVMNHRQAISFTLPFLFFCFWFSVTGEHSSLNMDEILQRLTEISIRQQQIVDHLATHLGEMEQGLEALRTTAAQRIPLPDPRVQAAKLLPKRIPHDDVEACLHL